MNEAIVTQWFELSQQKPWEQGVYECMLEHLGSRVLFGYFDGQSFVRFEHDIDRLLDRKHKGTFASCVKWRGLSSLPAAPKKHAGNKRKTMYVVLALWSDGMMKSEGAYNNLDLAKDHVARLEKNKSCDDTWFEKIRFRTPEA